MARSMTFDRIVSIRLRVDTFLGHNCCYIQIHIFQFQFSFLSRDLLFTFFRMARKSRQTAGTERFHQIFFRSIDTSNDIFKYTINLQYLVNIFLNSVSPIQYFILVTSRFETLSPLVSFERHTYVREWNLDCVCVFV